MESGASMPWYPSRGFYKYPVGISSRLVPMALFQPGLKTEFGIFFVGFLNAG
jgi:hypothetical protein